MILITMKDNVKRKIMAMIVRRKKKGRLNDGDDNNRRRCTE